MHSTQEGILIISVSANEAVIIEPLIQHYYTETLVIYHLHVA